MRTMKLIVLLVVLACIVQARAGIWIENGFVDPGEAVKIEVRLDALASARELPKRLAIHPGFLESQTPPIELPLRWTQQADSWVAWLSYRPRQAGNYYASITFRERELSAYFASWKPGISVVNFWVMLAAEYHSRGNHEDLYVPEIGRLHLPFDYELALVGEKVFSEEWPVHRKLRDAQETLAAEVIPYLDGGYFHRLNPKLEYRFKLDAKGRLPDPTFHGITQEQCEGIIEGARGHWRRLGYRPFSGISTYCPSNPLLDACRSKGVPWISGLFPEYDYIDGSDRWQAGWVQRDAGMPELPYFVSRTDFRYAAAADAQGTMIIPADRRNPVLNHGGLICHGTDTQNCIRHFGAQAAAAKLLEYGEHFFRNSELNRYEFPFEVSFTVQMNDEDDLPGILQANRDLITGLADRARKGDIVFCHKRHLQQYYRRHLKRTPDYIAGVPDMLQGVAPEVVRKHYLAPGTIVRPEPDGFVDPAAFRTNFVKPDPFPDVIWWEGTEGKAAFVNGTLPELIRVRHDGGRYLPVWWYRYSGQPRLDDRDLPRPALLDGVSIELVEGQTPRLLVKSPRPIASLPIALWDLSERFDAAPQKLSKLNVQRGFFPTHGQPYAIIRFDLPAGETAIPLASKGR